MKKLLRYLVNTILFLLIWFVLAASFNRFAARCFSSPLEREKLYRPNENHGWFFGALFYF